MPNMKVGILGLGSAGAYAAKAAKDYGCDVDVYVNGDPGKFPPGPFWLHWIPDDLREKFAPIPIYNIGKGSAKAYQKLQWGSASLGTSTGSFPERDEYLYGYDPSRVLEDLVPLGVNVEMVAYPFSDVEISDFARAYDIVFQTFPTKLSKEKQPAYLPFAVASKLGWEDPKVNYVIYNGTGDGIIVREAQLFGNKFFEFPKNVAVSTIKRSLSLPDYDIVTIKDMDPSTKPWKQPPGSDPKVNLIGRWAEWNTKRLSHEVYRIVLDKLEAANG